MNAAEMDKLAAATVRARKPRGPSKKTRQARDDLEQAAYLRGYDTALRETTVWPGSIAALVLAAIAFGFGAWLF